MRITKFLFPLSLIYNFILALILFNYFMSKVPHPSEQTEPQKFPVLLFQKNQNGTIGLNLSPFPISIDGLRIPAASISNGMVTPVVIPHLPHPGSFVWNNETFKFPSEYAKVSPEIVRLDETPHCPFCVKKNDQWIIPSGTHHVDSMIVIPANLTLVLSAGAVLNFTSNGGLFTRSPVLISGRKDAPVVLKGNEWKGFTVLSPLGTNKISYLEASGGKGFDFLGMRYSGMLNFITGNYEIQNLTIHHSKAEDGINLKWTKAKINNLKITDSFSDAMDIDWSEAELSNVVIHQAGNDCLDFSGGSINANNVQLSYCHDKAISNGEGNKLTLSETTVDQSKTGIANKDGAFIKVGNFKISNSKTIFTQYLGKHFYSEPVTEFESQPESINTGKALITSGKVNGNAAL